MIRIGILNLCLKELKKSNNPNYKIGAVIFKGSRIISSGFNKFRSSSIPLKYRKYEDSLHAEQSALLNADNWKLLKNSSILVIRLNKSGNLWNSSRRKLVVLIIQMNSKVLLKIVF